ncbi:hypothetical protein I4U23_008760 [Adineta vaga]|nr:hypothetical protein I4U23_008760 [Adineta vaga]
MPNLTSYHASPIHLYRELPKTYCDLIRHETDYIHFLRTRIAHIHSSLSHTNRKVSKQTNPISQRKHFDHNQRLFDVYRYNLKLCKKILQIWTNDGAQKGGVDCHNENYQQKIKISHFRLRQKQCKDKIERENKRFIHSLIYHRKIYQPNHDRAITQQSFKRHLKLRESINLLDYNNLPEHIYHNFSQFYNSNPKFSLQTHCQTLPRSYHSRKLKPQPLKTLVNKHIKTNAPPTYVENVLRQTINDAIHIYNQPHSLSSSSSSKYERSKYSTNDPWLKSCMTQQPKLTRSISCRQLLKPWHTIKSSEIDIF